MPVTGEFDVRNVNRTVGGLLSSAVTKVHGAAGLPPRTIRFTLRGCGRAVVRRVAGARRRADPVRRRQRLHRQGPLRRRADRPPARGRDVQGRGERPHRQHRALRRDVRPRVLPRPRGRALRGPQQRGLRRRRGRRRPRLRVHDRRPRRRPRPHRAQLRRRHERRRRLRARRGRHVRRALQHGPGRVRPDRGVRRDRAARPDRGARRAHRLAGRRADPRQLGRVPAAVREGHAARLQARAARDGRGRARGRGVDRRRGLRRPRSRF